MRAFAKKLTRGEIDALATYYADLPAKLPADPARSKK
jgi:cytochrome c553